MANNIVAGMESINRAEDLATSPKFAIRRAEGFQRQAANDMMNNTIKLVLVWTSIMLDLPSVLTPFMVVTHKDLLNLDSWCLLGAGLLLLVVITLFSTTKPNLRIRSWIKYKSTYQRRDYTEDPSYRPLQVADRTGETQGVINSRERQSITGNLLTSTKRARSS